MSTQRCLKGQLSLQALKAKIFYLENIEKYVATKNDKLNKHENKWKRVDLGLK